MQPKEESGLQIEKDLERTFCHNSDFRNNGPGVRKMRTVLRAYSCYD